MHYDPATDEYILDPGDPGYDPQTPDNSTIPASPNTPQPDGGPWLPHDDYLPPETPVVPPPPGPTQHGPTPPGPVGGNDNPYVPQPPTQARVPGTTEYPIAGGKTSFSYPDWVPPDVGFADFTAPSFDVQPFTYQDYVGPTAENFTADPGYDFRMKQQLNAVKNARSSQGLLSTGGTLTDLMTMAGGLASQEFGNVDNRMRQTYNTNRANQADIWGKNYQGESDEFTRALTGYLTQEQAKQGEWDRSRQTYATNLGKEQTGYGLNLDTSQLNLSRDNAQFGNLLSLYNIMTRTLPTYTPTAGA